MLSTLSSVPESTCIPLKTAATIALPLVCTTIKLKVRGLNPAHDIFLTTTFILACESAGVMVCNTPQPAHRADTLVS